MEHMIYVGRIPSLRGEKALVQSHSPHGVVAQFDKDETGFSRGWYLFHVADFVSKEQFDAEYNKWKSTHDYSHNAAIRKAIERLSA